MDILNGRTRVPEAVITRELDGETVLLNLDTGIYFGLDPVGTDLWRAVTAGASLGDALRTLQAQYDADPAVVREDFIQLVDLLLAKGLLERADDESAPTA